MRVESVRVEFRKERRGFLNFKIPIKYRTETIRAGIRAARRSERRAMHLVGPVVTSAREISVKCVQMRRIYVLRVYIMRCAEPCLRSCGRRDSRRRNRRTVADTSDVMRRNFANKQIRGPGAQSGAVREQSIHGTGRAAEFEASDRAVPRS